MKNRLPFWGFVFFTSGCTALSYEVIWTKWLSLVFGSTSYATTSVLVCFMAALSLGAYSGNKIKPCRSSTTTYAFLELGIALFALLTPYLIHSLDAVYYILTPPHHPRIFRWLLTVVYTCLTIGAPAFLMGATFPCLVRIYKTSQHSEKNVGVLYALNTLGASAGALATGYYFIEYFGLLATNGMAAAVNVTLAAITFFFGENFIPQQGIPSGSKLSSKKPERKVKKRFSLLRKSLVRELHRSFSSDYFL